MEFFILPTFVLLLVVGMFWNELRRQTSTTDTLTDRADSDATGCEADDSAASNSV